MQVSTNVFDRYGADSLSERAFYLTLGIILVYGLGIGAYVANYAAQADLHFSIIQILLIGLGIPILGIFILHARSAVTSFIGYNMIVIPLAFILGPLLNVYSPEVVAKTLRLTAIITIFMGIMGLGYPQLFAGLGKALFIALLGLIIARLFQLFIPGLLGFRLIDYLGAGIFSLYIGYDMYRASSVPRTVNNAIDIGANLYLDIVNLVVHLLPIFGDD